jgi:uncharacterized protein
MIQRLEEILKDLDVYGGGKKLDGSKDMAKIITPCKQICELDEIKQICKTCKRTEEEIASWLDYTPAERKAVMKQIKDRLWQ